MNLPSLSLERFLRHYLSAVQAFTRVPVTGSLASWVGLTPDMMRASAPHFPGVGWLVGMGACVAFALTSLMLADTTLTPLAAAVMCMIASAALTGAAHEKALLATTGSVAALQLVLLLKVTLLGVLGVRSPAALLTALLAAHTVSRFWPLVLMRTLPTSDAWPPMDRGMLVIGALWCVVPLALMVVAHRFGFAIGALLMSGAAMWAVQGWLRTRVGVTTSDVPGVTGSDALGVNRSEALGVNRSDALGVAQQVCEVAFYFGAIFGLGSR